MDNVVIENVRERIVDSLIGSGAKIVKGDDKPRGLKLIVGEQAYVRL